jgi:iron complex transport system ATP-binding protein
VNHIITTRNLSVSYDDTHVLSDITLTVEEGDFLSVLGPNGAGKTTLIKALTGVIGYVGDITLYGRPVHTYRKKEFARQVAFLPQDLPATLPYLVQDIVMMGRFPYLKRFEIEKPRDARIVRESMYLLGLEKFSSRHLSELSGGELKRVFIAQAIAQESNIMFLDEPTANLDINYQAEIFKLLTRFNEEMGKTIILVTHDINHAARFAKKIIFLKDGRIVRTGKPVDIIDTKTIRSVFNTDVTIQYDHEKRPYILI